MKHLLKHECPNLKNTEYRKALLFIDGRCSQYYFLDYLKCCNNVADAIKLYDIDDKFRCILFQHLIRFEMDKKSFVCTLILTPQKEYLNQHPIHLQMQDDQINSQEIPA